MAVSLSIHQENSFFFFFLKMTFWCQKLTASPSSSPPPPPKTSKQLELCPPGPEGVASTNHSETRDYIKDAIRWRTEHLKNRWQLPPQIPLLSHNLALWEFLWAPVFTSSPESTSKAFSNSLSKKLVDYSKVHAITSPTATRGPLRAPQRSRRQQKRHH